MLDNKAKIQLRKALTYANGYRELEMFAHAHEELDRLPASMNDTIETLQMRLAIDIDSETWPSALARAKTLRERQPQLAEHYVNLAFVTRRCDSLEKAKAILMDAFNRFPAVAIIHYNLACYANLEGNADYAKELLKKAFSLDRSFIEKAKEDEDLESLAEWISATSGT